jgi:FixJ family two-component response regulator
MTAPDRVVGMGGDPDEMPVVFVVDDDISVRESLELLIRSAGWLPETSASAQGFLRCPRVSVANCLILDINLPDLNGLDVQRLVCAERAEMPIIFVTGAGDVPITVEAMKAGAVEFLTKPINEDALLTAVEQALGRSRALLARREDVRELSDRYSSLSRRERQVMALVISGLMNKQIAFELGISEVTVKAHRGQMMRKMMARSLPDLVNMSAKLKAEHESYSSTGDLVGSSSE